jgi:hypothetical protein
VNDDRRPRTTTPDSGIAATGDAHSLTVRPNCPTPIRCPGRRSTQDLGARVVAGPGYGTSERQAA